MFVFISGDINSGIKDELENLLDGDRDGDPEGSPEDDIRLTFVTTLLGDFNKDRKVNINDLYLFRSIWVNKDTFYEIGPAVGELPQMLVQPDGRVDFGDLMVFVMNWNWSVRSGGFKFAEKVGYILDVGAESSGGEYIHSCWCFGEKNICV